ncbi:MAG: formylglycine-generating enzyme family protein [Proteobacteria bacterium]|nr:formylglycine-generating enzyme family protein [Pseudomonadota bacterium]MBU1716323.1 formylglycine-generating enzyme family protein [Pseudomonadota bacterium]
MKMIKLVIYLIFTFFLLHSPVSAADTENKNTAGDNQRSAGEKPSPDKTIKTWTEPFTGMEFVWVEPGCFGMGQGSIAKSFLLKEVNKEDYVKYYADELPLHEICLDGFWIGKYEVTQGQWQKVLGNNLAHFQNGDQFPVEQVSWNDAQEFIKILNRQNKENLFRLPTEAEWEYAARAGTTTPFNTGEIISTTQANYNGTYLFGYGAKEEYRQKTTAVGSFPPNPFGIFDMHGNVWEWCLDWYGKDYYKDSPHHNPIGPKTGEAKVLRGGSWFRSPSTIRSATRYNRNPDGRYADTGFRLVKGLMIAESVDNNSVYFNQDF